MPQAPVDSLCPLAKKNAKVHADYDCMLNQTNIGANNNKFYVIQVLEAGGKYYAWNRWGRVGEDGAVALKGPFSDASAAIKDFSKKFRDKTANDWTARAQFKAKAGRYTLIEIAHDASAKETKELEKKLHQIDDEVAKIQPKAAKIAPSKIGRAH